jgi:hypothetical protein
MNAPIYENRTMPEMFSRGFWMMLGPMLLVPFTYKIIEHGNGWLTVFDLAFLGTILAMILARGFEFYKGRPRTAEGEPATFGHLRRYLIGLLIVAAAVWIVANVLGNYVFDWS